MYREEWSVVWRGIECCIERNDLLYGEEMGVFREEWNVVWRGIECCIERNWVLYRGELGVV